MSTAEIGKLKDGTVSLNYPMLTRGNYMVWAMKMNVYMQAYGVWKAIETIENDKIEDRTDKIALVVIYQEIPEDILPSLAEKRTAKEAWQTIKMTCQGVERVKTAKIQMLKSEFERMSMRESESLDDFYLKLSGLVTNIRAMGETIPESYIVKKLRRAVPQKFLQIVATLEQFGNLDVMTVEELIGSLKAHEERLRGPSESGGSKLLLTKEEWTRQERDGKLLLTREEWLKRASKDNAENASGQRYRNNVDTRGKDIVHGGIREKSRIRCFNGNYYGHFAIECRKLRQEKDTKEEANMM
ncbi:uncharacterized protein LOC141680110 [Apium graveolens]|uniref:uncharacterized protein LOC141680110 n=1 Tax=Apium graveolens TaxID=4045 RepID=UPI003D7935EC